MLRNRFENATINGWDGNSIDLGDDNGGTILAPQVGAGYKDQDNKFTGIVIGKAKDSEAKGSAQKQDIISGRKFAGANEDIGLFGFNAGARSIFLDAKTGKAVFGEKNKAQIILDPSENTAKIKSGNYNYEPEITTGANAGAGMEIDLSTPYIKYGTGNFEVNENGHLIAKGGGSIANWEISDYKLTSGTTGMCSRQIPDEKAETITYKSPFSNLIPSLLNWKNSGIYTSKLVSANDWPANKWINITNYSGSSFEIVAKNTDYEIKAKSDINYRVHTIINTLQENKEGIILYSSNSNITDYRVQMIILAYGKFE